MYHRESVLNNGRHGRDARNGRRGAVVATATALIGLLVACAEPPDAAGSTTTPAISTTTLAPPSTTTTAPPDSDDVPDADVTVDPATGLGLDADGNYVPLPLEWTSVDLSTEEAPLLVPVDYTDPSRGAIELYVTRHSATDPSKRIGSLLVNPGGPGFGGSDYALYADQIFDPALLEHFDIIGWDPRGTGFSEPVIDCVEDYDRYFGSLDVAADQQAESERLAREFADGCVASVGDVMGLLGTNNSARDMDSIRRALGEEQISYLGFSYGSELGAVWATLFPETVRAAVFDGAADPTADALESSLQQMAGFESTLATFLANCSADPMCAFHNEGDAEGAFDALMEQLEAEPIPSDPGRPMVGRSIATSGVIMAMYSESYWPELEMALVAATQGDGSGLLALHDTYYQRVGDGLWGNELEAFQVISCADTTERPTVEEEQSRIPLFAEVAPRLVPADAAASYFCSFFPAALDPRVEVTGAGAGPIVVMGTTGDATTPLASTRTMAETLEDGRLVIVESNDHGAYFVSECARRIVNETLIDGRPPDNETRCS